MELADDGTNDVPDVRALVMEMMTNLFISTYNHQVYCTKVCKHSCQFGSFSVHIPSMFFNFRMKRAVATVIPLQNSLKETQMKIWRHQNRESKSPKKHKTNKVELPYIIQTKEGRHYRNSQTRRTRESEYFIDLISSNHSEFGIVGG